MSEKPKILIPEKVVGFKKQIGQYTPSKDQAILYALGIGFSQDPLKNQDHKYTNEGDPDFTLFPTFVSCFNQSGSLRLMRESPHIPKFELHQLLHGEEKIYLLSKIEIGVKYTITCQITDVIDKGKYALLNLRVIAFTNNNQQQVQAFYIDRNFILLGLGGFGFKGYGKSEQIKNFPNQEPTLVLEDRIFDNQNFVYRLSGDINPLHIDLKLAKKAGFQKPILQGLATFGVVIRCIVQHVLKNEPKWLRSLKAKFVGHVYPGQQLLIKVWKQKQAILFLTETKVRKTKVLIGEITVEKAAI